jgi:putative spermidine/putrescine transport system permease protein
LVPGRWKPADDPAKIPYPNLERTALGLGSSHTRVFLPRRAADRIGGGHVGGAFAFLASFDALLISLFLPGVQAQTLPVRIWNSLNLQVEPTIAAVSAFLIPITTLTLGAEAILRYRFGQRRAPG